MNCSPGRLVLLGLAALVVLEVAVGFGWLLPAVALIAVSLTAAKAGAIAQRKRYEAQVEQLKAGFFALISHELRTPLTSIIGYLNLLEDGLAETREEQQHFMSVVDRNAQRLLSLVNDLLFAAQVDAGHMNLVLVPCDLAELTLQAVQNAQPRAQEAGVELALDGSVDTAPMNGDADRLTQVVGHLLGNALKFTPAGGTVNVRLCDAGKEYHLEVQDTGMGIPPEEVEHLFERFFRSHRVTDQSIQGAGLGLTIVRAIVEGHGGKVEAQSILDEGSTFSVRLPKNLKTDAKLSPSAERISAEEKAAGVRSPHGSYSAG